MSHQCADKEDESAHLSEAGLGAQGRPPGSLQKGLERTGDPGPGPSPPPCACPPPSARLADLMEQHQEELATIEALDSGAVYTLALKTHVGMSIQTFRYFAGWCDKIQGSTIPINQARPNRNLSLTRKEPIG